LEFGSFDENIMLRDFSKFIKKSLDNNQLEITENIRNCLQISQNNLDKQNTSTLGSLTHLVSIFFLTNLLTFSQLGWI